MKKILTVAAVVVLSVMWVLGTYLLDKDAEWEAEI